MMDLYKTAPPQAMPRFGTKAFIALQALATGEAISIRELDKILGSPSRDAISTLGKDRMQNWNISRVKNQFDEYCYRLHKWHLSGSKMLDARARLRQKRDYKKDSETQAASEKRRLPRAKKEAKEAIKAYKKAH